MATEYGLDGPGSNPGGDEMFCPSRPFHGAHICPKVNPNTFLTIMLSKLKLPIFVPH